MSRVLILISCVTLCGCVYVDERPNASSERSASTKSIVRYMPPADQYVKSKLIDFDSPYDTTFLKTANLKLVDDPDKPGNRVLSTTAAQIKLGSLVRGREFPGRWDLLGVRVRSARSQQIQLAIVPGQAAASAESSGEDGWSIRWIELRSLPSTIPATEELLLNVASLDGRPILIDDVILAQSHTVLTRSVVPVSGQAWIVQRSGLRWQVIAGDRELLSLPAQPFVPSGYRVVESNAVRSVFASETSQIAIDRVGRLIENGRTRLDAAIVSFAKTTAENQSPAIVDVPGDQGRVERNLPGDKDNDGYDESRGCYTVRANGSRVSISLTPQKFPVKWPVLDVIGLPAGELSVWLQGELVPWVTRLSDGRWIIELPITLERPIEVQVRVK